MNKCFLCLGEEDFVDIDSVVIGIDFLELVDFVVDKENLRYSLLFLK